VPGTGIRIFLLLFLFLVLDFEPRFPGFSRSGRCGLGAMEWKPIGGRGSEQRTNLTWPVQHGQAPSSISRANLLRLVTSCYGLLRLVLRLEPSKSPGFTELVTLLRLLRPKPAGGKKEESSRKVAVTTNPSNDSPHLPQPPVAYRQYCSHLPPASLPVADLRVFRHRR